MKWLSKKSLLICLTLLMLVDRYHGHACERRCGEYGAG